jgi:teichuronic acid biosynthesis glycosyltransferase TuaH
MKILYLMHVNWRWIRQRPHVLADLLSEQHTVMVMHYAMYKEHHAANETLPPLQRELHRVPQRLKRLSPTWARWGDAWTARQVRIQARQFRPDVVWCTHPDFAASVSRLGSCRVVYDCMDDHLAFAPDPQGEMARAEAALLQRADLTLFSSQTLAERVSGRGPLGKHLVVNNGWFAKPAVGAPTAGATTTPSNVFILGYFGTVSHWFDWALVLKLLDTIPHAKLLLAGPCEISLPIHPRIEHVGVLPHEQLAAFASRCQALVMPFAVTPLIEAVDPVKLYEYIAFQKPALAPRYRETERFAPFVSLYDDVADATRQVQQWVAGVLPAPQIDAAQAFLAANTWQHRCTEILRALG